MHGGGGSGLGWSALLALMSVVVVCGCCRFLLLILLDAVGGGGALRLYYVGNVKELYIISYMLLNRSIVYHRWVRVPWVEEHCCIISVAP